VLEEYVEPERTPTPSTDPALVVLSARNEEQLREQVAQLRTHLDAHAQNLVDLAYTLQVGRDALTVRLALLVSTVQELKEKLSRFLAAQDGIENVWRGEVKGNREMLAVFTADEELQEAIGKWIARAKIGKLAELWVQGLVIDWHALYRERPRRIPLPTYPFAQERYWVQQGNTDVVASQHRQSSESANIKWLHPLLQRKSTNGNGQLLAPLQQVE
jgi:polyketide synthase PksN